MHQQLLSKNRVVRLAFLALITGFCLTLLVAGTPASQAHADGPCVVRGPFATVIDSYGHDEGVLSLHHNYCLNTSWATFLSNSNTWQWVQVTFYDGVDVGHGNPGNPNRSKLYNWQANTNFDSPMIAAAPCEYNGRVDMIDNRGNWITVEVGGVFGSCF